MIPPDERFELHRTIDFEVEDRLIENLELIAIDRSPEIGLNLQQVHIRRVHFAVEDFATRLPRLLRSIHGRVSVTEEIFRIAIDLIRDDDADTGGSEHFVISELERRREFSLQALGDHGRVFGIEYLVQQDREFVAPNRATMSLGRTQVCNRFAMPIRSLSPMT
jgi:hypothetical protein